MLLDKDKSDLHKIIAIKSKEPFNKFLSYLILAKLNEGCSKYKCFLQKLIKIFLKIFIKITKMIKILINLWLE